MISTMASIIRKAEGVVGTATAVAQSYRESAMEKKTRSHRKFHDFESTLPAIKKVPEAEERDSLASNLLSNLGRFNPLPHNITAKDTVWLLDNTAYRNPKTKEWEAEFVAAVFDQSTGLEVSTVVADLAEKLGLGKGDAQEETIRQRLMLFMQNILPGRKVQITVAQKDKLTLGPGGRHAISSDIKPLAATFKGGEIVPSAANVPEGANGVLHMNTVFAEPEGWGVISGKIDGASFEHVSY